MREIKFRAWKQSTGCMIQHIGSIEFMVDGSYIINGEDPDCIIMQFTGLKDKNGKEIYDGDILDFDAGEWGGEFEPEVILMSDLIGTWNYCGSIDDVSEWREIIGNIYENPNLITT